MRRQRTIQRPIAVRGHSFISGLDIVLRFCPAPEHAGLHFVRVDLDPNRVVPVDVDRRLDCPRRTTLADGDVRVEMTEHVLAALRGLGVDNCRIEVNGPETPGCDGSSLQFARALLDAGIQSQSAWCEPLVLEHPICVSDGKAFVAALPNPHGYLEVDYTLDYTSVSRLLGRQRFICQLNLVNFLGEVAPARTFLLREEAEQLRAMGWGSRTTARDLLIYDDDGPIDNAERYPDEPARHKALDIIGDLALAGRELVASVIAYRSGHRLNAALARAIRQCHNLDVTLSIGAGVPIWPGVLSELPPRTSKGGTGQFVISEQGGADPMLARGAALLAAWLSAARCLGRGEQLDLVEFCHVSIDRAPEPAQPFAVSLKRRDGGEIELQVVQDDRLLGRASIRPAAAVARAA